MTKKNLSSCESQIDIQKIIGWKPPVFHQASECYVSLVAYDPSAGKMRLKKIMLGHIKGKRQQRIYGNELIKRLTEKLLNGWNPWIEETRPSEYVLFSEVCEKYKLYLAKLMKDGGIRPGTVVNYTAKLSLFLYWIKEKHVNVTYVYQFNKSLVRNFLDYIFIERNNTIRTRNNYIGWLQSFSSFLLERDYVKQSPMQGVKTNTMVGKKSRSTIPDNVLKEIKEHLELNNKHLLLACYMLHYLFIRPHEMSFLKIKDISAKNKTITISGEYSKNRKSSVVTIPNHVMELIYELDTLSFPSNYYVFSNTLRPGLKQTDSAEMRKFWKKEVQKPLGLSKEYKFYSLKDTGITNMLKAHTDLLSVRDQARHSSVSMTNVYTPSEVKGANIEIIDYEGVF